MLKDSTTTNTKMLLIGRPYKILSDAQTDQVLLLTVIYYLVIYSLVN